MTTTTTKATQFLLVSNPGIVLSSAQNSNLKLALIGATSSLATFLGRVPLRGVKPEARMP